MNRIFWRKLWCNTLWQCLLLKVLWKWNQIDLIIYCNYTAFSSLESTYYIVYILFYLEECRLSWQAGSYTVGSKSLKPHWKNMF